MIDWAEPEFLFVGGAGLALLIALLARSIRRRRWALNELVGSRLLGSLTATVKYRSDRIRNILMWSGLAFLVIAAAGPRWGREVVKVSGQGSDLVLVFDTSHSMNVRDVPPSRLEEAKREAHVLVKALQGDRIGLVIFSGDATVLTPLTLDYSAVRLLIRSLSTDMVSRPGTDIGKGIRSALSLLQGGTPSEQAIVVFTDGEDLERGAKGVAAVASRRGVRIFAVGIGTPGGQAIPIQDDAGREIGVKRKTDGEVVVSRLDEKLLREIARKTGGAYFSAQHPGGEVTRLRRAVSRVERGHREGRLGSRPVERFAIFAWLAWLCLLVAWLWPRRMAMSALQALRKSSLTIAAMMLSSTLLFASPVQAGELEEGNKAYEAGNYDAAVGAYRRGLDDREEDWRLLGNLGNALYRLEDYKAAEDAYSRALTAAKDKLKPETDATIRYNLGNSLFRQERFAESADYYRASLEKLPDDPDARFNYEAALARLTEPPEPPPQSGGGGGGGGGGGDGDGQDSPSPQNPSPAPAPPPKPIPDQENPTPGESGQLNRTQAERLLDALAEEEARAQRHRGRARVSLERTDRDW